MPSQNNWIASECAKMRQPHHKQWHGIGARVCANYNKPEEIYLNATLEFSFAKNSYVFENRSRIYLFTFLLNNVWQTHQKFDFLIITNESSNPKLSSI
jgi:hypothetical protein